MLGRDADRTVETVLGRDLACLLDAVARGVAARPNGLPPTVKSMMLISEYMKRYYHGRYYAKAQNLRPALVRAYDAVLAHYDVLLMPTVPFRATPIPPPNYSLEETIQSTNNMTVNTAQFDATGHPLISVPCGMEEDLPIGMMITGQHFDDLSLLQVADAVEKSGNWRSF